MKDLGTRQATRQHLGAVGVGVGHAMFGQYFGVLVAKGQSTRELHWGAGWVA